MGYKDGYLYQKYAGVAEPKPPHFNIVYTYKRILIIIMLLQSFTYATVILDNVLNNETLFCLYFQLCCILAVALDVWQIVLVFAIKQGFCFTFGLVNYFETNFPKDWEKNTEWAPFAWITLLQMFNFYYFKICLDQVMFHFLKQTTEKNEKEKELEQSNIV